MAIDDQDDTGSTTSGAESSRSEATRAGRPGAAAARAEEPSFAERVRTLLHAGRGGMLATQSRRHPGHPFGSLAPYGLLDDGSPTFLLSRLAVHAQNLAADPRASLLVAEAAADTRGGDTAERVLAAPRATLLGSVARVPEETLDAARADYLARHESARAWAGFADFAFYRLEIAAAYYVAGFGAMGWVDAEELRAAAPDPLADSAAGILAHMNADHGDALLLYCRCFAGLEASEAAMTSVDRLGFAVRARDAEGERVLRIAFPQPVATPNDARKALVAMVREARAKLGVA